MRYKLLAVDLDDTLLGADSSVSPGNRQAVKEAQKAGLKVVIATGRMYRSARRIALQLGLNLPLITYHGALIRTVEEETIRHLPVPASDARELADFLQRKGFHVNIYISDSLFARQKNEYTRYYEKLAGVDLYAVGDLPQFLSRNHTDPTKMTVISWDENLLAPLRQELKSLCSEDGRLFSERLTFVQSRPYFLEITRKEANKANALDFLGKRYNIGSHEIAAVGDSYNDLDMIRYAGLGAAVANARPEVKESADYIVPPSTEDGVAFLIRQIIAEKI